MPPVKPPDPYFDPKEELYRRISKEHIDEENKIIPATIAFRNFSVNRGKYSKPEDVLHPDWKEWGIGCFTVEEIPEPIIAESGNKFELKVIHVPKNGNYAHSEIQTYKNKKYQKKPDPPEDVKKEIRALLSDIIKIIKKPSF